MNKIDNNHYHLDIKVPQFVIDRRLLPQSSMLCNNVNLPKYRIGELVTEIFGGELANNRFMNPAIGSLRVVKKKVRFYLIELDDDKELPNCRTHKPRVKHHLHAMTCPNFKFEQVEALGKQTFLARISLLR